jgi:hypothetical protein
MLSSVGGTIGHLSAPYYIRCVLTDVTSGVDINLGDYFMQYMTIIVITGILIFIRSRSFCIISSKIELALKKEVY